MDAHLLTADRAELLQIIALQEQTIIELQAEVLSLRAELTKQQAQSGDSGSLAARSVPAFVKPNRPQRPADQPRKKRAKGFARRRSVATRRVEHAVDQCPACGCTMRGGSVKRTRQVLHIPLVPLEVVEHVFIERRCPQCGKRHVPKPREVLKDVLGKHRLSVSTMAMVSVLREVGRLPVKTICWYLQTFHHLTLSVGEVVEVLHAVARQAQGSVDKIAEELQSSPVVHGDETTWREEGQNGYFWVFNTPTRRYFLHRFSRSGEIVNEVLGAAFDGTLVTDFYAGYNRMQGQHQRCWAHLLSAIHELKGKWPDAPPVQTWASEVHALYQRAKDYCATHQEAPPIGSGGKERVAAQHRYEQELLALAEPYLETDCPQQVLCKRIEHFLPELFTFVADPRVPSDNNEAERAIRPLAVSRKISGGTRSERGTQTKGTLATLFGTWLVQNLNPFTACCQLLTPP